MSNYTAPATPTATPAGGPAPEPDPEPGGPPYLPQTAVLGGVPTPALDAPLCAVFLALFLGGAALHMAVFQRNRRHGYKFLFSGLLFGFCSARVVALAMRVVWAAAPRNVSVAIASQIFTAAGVLLLFVTNLVFTQRLLRAYHPFAGWHRGVTGGFRALVGATVLVLVLVVAATVQSFFTLSRATREADRTLQLVAAVFLAVVAFLPIPAAAAIVLVPRRTRIDRFGSGALRTKIRLLVFTSTLLAAGAVFRAAAAFFPVPLRAPTAWWHSKPAYYLANFAVEVVVVYTYGLARFDRRFHVPDGSSAPGHYSCALEYGGSAAAVAAALADFEKGVGGPESPPIRSGGVGGSKRSSAWSGRWSRPAVEGVTVPAKAARASVETRRTRRSGRSLVFVAGAGGSSAGGSLEGLAEQQQQQQQVMDEVAGADGSSRDAELEWLAKAMVRGAFDSSRCCSRCSAGPVGDAGEVVVVTASSSVYSGDPGFGGVGYAAERRELVSPAPPVEGWLFGVGGAVGESSGGSEPEAAAGGLEAETEESSRRSSTSRPPSPVRTSSPADAYTLPPDSGSEDDEEEEVVLDQEVPASARRFPLISTNNS